MILFLVKRVGSLVLTLFISSIVIFGSMYLVPGDPAVYFAGGEKATPAQIAQLRAQFGLDDPPVERYVHWLTGALHGDFGISLQYREDVSTLIGGRLPVSAALIVYAGILIIIGGFVLGLWAALKGGMTDRSILGFTSAVVAMPSFVTAVILIGVFSVGLGWFPTTGAGEDGLDRVWHLTLPAIALALALVGIVARVARSAFLESMRGEHVTVARSRGVRESAVVSKHIVRNSLGPIVTLSGLVIAGLLVSTTIVETAFGLSGVGSLLRVAVTNQDYPIVQAISLLVVAAFLVCNTIVDISYPFIDPRVSLNTKKAKR